MSYLTDYENIDGGYVAFGGNPKGGKILGKSTIKTGNLDFENVYFVRELVRIKTEGELCKSRQSDLVRKRIEQSVWNGIGVNTGDSKLMLLGINLLLLVKVNAARHKLTTAAFLSKPAESEGFEQIVDLLNAHPIKHALMVNPTIYTSCIEQFWATIKAKTINREVQLQTLVDVKKIIITESTMIRDIQLEDAEGVDCLPNDTIFEQLALMGYEQDS
ncbi:hypothetical protein Tco_0104763 [Tanacetum coccineum]